MKVNSKYSLTRAEYMSKISDPGIPVYMDFDLMMKECTPDVVIVETVDRYHHEYIIKALEYGCDVITEKPMTIDDEKCNAILAKEKETGKKVIVTFNFRFAPYMTRVKELINEGVVGTYEVSKMVGYNSTKYFFKVFKQYTGFTPTEYRVKVISGGS